MACAYRICAPSRGIKISIFNFFAKKPENIADHFGRPGLQVFHALTKYPLIIFMYAGLPEGIVVFFESLAVPEFHNCKNRLFKRPFISPRTSIFE